MARIIPGVQIDVVKEVVPKQLTPTGVLGIAGVIEKKTDQTIRAASWKSFFESCGPGSSYSMPEARQALQNGVSELVISPVNGSIAATSTKGDLTFQARSGGLWGNNVTINITHKRSNEQIQGLTIKVKGPTEEIWTETHRNLSFLEVAQNSIIKHFKTASSLIKVKDAKLLENKGPFTKQELTDGIVLLETKDKDNNPKPVLKVSGDKNLLLNFSWEDEGFSFSIEKKEGQDGTHHTLISLSNILDEWALYNAFNAFKGMMEGKTPDTGSGSQFDFSVDFSPQSFLPEEGDYPFSGGADAGVFDYQKALNRLIDESDIDMVLAAVQDFSNRTNIINIYMDVISHCNQMSNDCKGRIGFGQVPPASPKANVKEHCELVNALVSDRFVFVAPHGVVGAVTGMIGSLKYYQSPTFKPVLGIVSRSRRLSIEEQRMYLKKFIVPVSQEEGRGIIVIKGITTDGDQINVRRIADRAVRGVKMIGELFIGRLNTDEGREALKQKVTEFLLQMKKENALVPSTDGSDPAFKVDVYSSQKDFVEGVVRVDIAVRPVRAIDYIYATIFIQV